MTPAEQAAADLKAIRGLMEKATIYQAISAPSALAAGSLAVAGATVFGAGWLQEDERTFCLVWGAVLAGALVFNAWFLFRAAQKRGEAFVSPGMKLALGALLPPVLLAGVLSLLVLAKGFHAWPERNPDFTPLGMFLVGIWITTYGLALLATQTFSPRSILGLGYGFLTAGLLFWASMALSWEPIHWPPAAWMGLTFGLFHLIYAAFAWPRRSSPHS